MVRVKDRLMVRVVFMVRMMFPVSVQWRSMGESLFNIWNTIQWTILSLCCHTESEIILLYLLYKMNLRLLEQVKLLLTKYICSKIGARCSFVVRAFAHGVMGRRIDPSWWNHWAISRSSQCPTTETKCNKAYGMCYPVCAWCI